MRVATGTGAALRVRTGTWAVGLQGLKVGVGSNKGGGESVSRLRPQGEVMSLWT